LYSESQAAVCGEVVKNIRYEERLIHEYEHYGI